MGKEGRSQRPKVIESGRKNIGLRKHESGSKRQTVAEMWMQDRMSKNEKVH